MAAQQPTEIWSQRGYTRNTSAQRVFIAPGYTTAAAAEAAVIGNFGVQPGAPHPDDQYLYVTFGGITCRNEGGPTTWIVNVPYTPIPQSVGTNDPLLRDTRWEITNALESIAIDVDRFGNPITNSAGTPIDPKPTRTINTLQISAFRYYPNYSISTALQYMNKVNASAIQVKSLGLVPAGCMKCLMIQPTNPIILTKPAPIEVVHRFEIRGALVSGVADDPAYALRFLDQGYSGWYKDAQGRFQPGEFSEKDPRTANNATPEYINRSQITLMNGRGGPLDYFVMQGQPVMIGEGQNPKTPEEVGPSQHVPDLQQVRRVYKNGVAFLHFDAEDRIEFAPLISGL